MNRRLWAPFFVLLLASFAFAQGHSRRTTTKKAPPPVIPNGTVIHVRMIDALSSEKNKPGDPFTGTLENDITDANGSVIFPKGADVKGRVNAVHDSGRLSDPGVLELQLVSIMYGTRVANVSAPPFVIKGESHTKSNVVKIGGGTAAGAIIGGIAGGGKGALIGSAIGAAGGTGVAAATGKKNASVESEAVLDWTTDADVTVGSGTRSTAPTNTSTTTNTSDTAETSNTTTNENYTDDNEPPADGLSFGGRDRRVIRECFTQNASSLPPGLAKRDKLPPGLERQLQKNGTLPPGLQKRVQSLPEVCERQLPSLPDNIERVIYSRRVMLLDDNTNRILDIFDLDRQ
jgi:hypothetical protein